MALQSSAFYYDYQDLQLSQIVGLQVNIDNAAKSTVWGIELETQFYLTDEEYIMALISVPASVSFNRATHNWAPPRTWGLEAIWGF